MTDGSKIVSLNGNDLPEPGKVNPKIVKVLEEELERARAGNTAGIVIVTVDHECRSFYRIHGQNLSTYNATGACFAVAHQLAKDITRDD